MTKNIHSYYNKSCSRERDLPNADVAELVDAQDLKSCGLILRAGSIPAICTKERQPAMVVFFIFQNLNFSLKSAIISSANYYYIGMKEIFFMAKTF